MSEPEPETKTTTKLKVVMICIIGNSFSSHFLKCWTEFLGYCLSHNIRPMLSNIIENGSFVDKNNCFLCNSENSEMQTPFQGKLEYDYILYLSSKCVFPANVLDRLIEINEPIVAPYSMKPGNMNQVNFVETIDFNSDQECDYVLRDTVETYNKEGVEYIKVDYVDTQLMLLKKGVLEKIEYPWFGGNSSGETFFFRKCKEKNIPLFIDLKNRLMLETKIIL
tara:strand:+ start:8017 stop:8682 length:666 start_codon:yes stop_codon:yes gene_type:complete